MLLTQLQVMLHGRAVMSAILILESKALKIDWEQRETPSLILLSLVILLLSSSFIKFPVFLPRSHKQKTVSSEQKKKCRTGHYPINFKGIILGPKVDTFYWNYAVWLHSERQHL